MPTTTPRITRRALLGGAAALGASLLLPRGVRAAAGGPRDLAHAVVGLSGTRSADVVIVGAGLAGLTAARVLVAAGVGDVVVLEARQRVGGRTLNADLGDGRVVEIGGQWVGPLPNADHTGTATVPTQAVYRPQDKIYGLAQQLGIGTFPTYNKGQYVDYSSVTGRTTYDSSTRIPVDPGTLDAGKALFLLNQMAAQVNPEHPWDTPDPLTALRWDATSFETWMRDNLIPSYPADQDPGSAFYSLVNLGVEAVFAAEPRDLSLLHVLFYIAAAGTFDNLVDTANGAQDSRFIGGSQLVSIRAADQLGDRVVLGAPVRRISQNGSRVVVSGEGFSVTARRAIVAIPPALAGRIAYDPPLASFDGGLRDQLTQRMPMGSVIKVMAFYERPFWRDMGLAGQTTSDTGPVKITFDNSPYPDPQHGSSSDVSPGVLLGFIEGEDGRRYSQPAYDGRRRQHVIASLARYFGPQAADPIGYLEMLWMREEYTGGCYGGFLGTGVWTSYGPALRAPLGLVHWAGTETATRWNGYMDGAVQSGERAAGEVLAAFGLAAPPPIVGTAAASALPNTRATPATAGEAATGVGAAAATATAALARRLRR